LKIPGKLVLLAVSSAAWLLLLEVPSAYWVEKWGDPLDKTRPVLMANGELGWCQRPGLNCRFFGVSLRTDALGWRVGPATVSGQASRTVLVLGPSSTFGRGMEYGHTYSSFLEETLNNEYAPERVRVINAGQIGFSSWQGLKFYQMTGLEKLKADVLVIAYGVNDVDRFRFYFNSSLSDKEEFAVPKNPVSVFLQNALLRFHFIHLASRYGSRLLEPFRRGAAMGSVRRVDDDDFERNIRALVRLGRTNGSKIVLLTTAHHLPPSGAGEMTSVIASDIQNINDRVRKLAVVEDVPVADIEKDLAVAGEEGVFLDPVHFSEKGNKKIAEILAGVIRGGDLLKKGS